MRRSPAISIALLIVLLLAMAVAFGTMLGRRFSGGEDFEAYSTRRADPQGAKALYDALDRLATTTCERNFRRLGRLGAPSDGPDASLRAAARHGQTLVLLNVPPSSFEEGEELDAGPLVEFAAAGGRVVITTTSNQGSISKIQESAEKRREELREKERKAEEEKHKKEEAAKNDGKKDGGDDPKTDKPAEGKKKKGDREKDDESPVEPPKSIQKLLGVAVAQKALSEVPREGHKLDTPEGLAVLGGRLPPWFSTATLTLGSAEEKKEKTEGEEKPEAKPAAKEPWKVLATVKEQPVLAERYFGKGSIVIATDTRFASNQDLMLQPATEFLAWLIGDARHVIFDETHLGTEENPGIMTLARRFRLQGFFLGGVLLFALFVWQSSSSLVPPDETSEDPARTVAGQGAVAGLVSLLRRGVPRSQLLDRCFEQWERGHRTTNPSMKARIEKARALLAAGHTKRLPRGRIVSLYQQLRETLHPNRH